MANPQKENGFTPIANELLEAISGASLNGTQLRILLLLWRNSYGFHKKECALPLSYLTKMLRGNKSTISREVRRLEAMGLISSFVPGVTEGSGQKAEENGDGGEGRSICHSGFVGGRVPKIYRFNKDYEKWLCGAGPAGRHTLRPLTGPQDVGGQAYGTLAGGLTDKDKKIRKNSFYRQKGAINGYETKKPCRYDYDEIERKTFLAVTKRFREGGVHRGEDE